MTHNLFYDLIELQYFKQIYPQIQREERGVLYKVINKVINLSEEEQSKTEEVCNYFGIKQDSNIEEDFGIAYDNMEKIYLDYLEGISIKFLLDKLDGVSKMLSQAGKSTFTKLCSMLKYEQQMKIIVITAVIFVAVFLLVYKSKPPKQNQRRGKLLEEKGTVPAAICLVVPASAVYSLTKGTVIEKEKIIQLIDVASYFSCIQVEEAEKLNIDIDINQLPSSDSQLPFYLRIDIPDGQERIGAETKYPIKRDLPSNIQGKIKELGRLISVDSVSSFNRI